MSKLNAKNIAFISTVPHLFDTQLRPLFAALIANDWTVTCLCNKKPDIADVQYKSIKIRREISVLSDLISVFSLLLIFFRSNYYVIHTYSPKGGLLGQIAGFLTLRKHRLHTYTGQVWYNKTGFQRHILKFSDRLIGLLSTQCFCDSASQRDYLIDQGVIKASKIRVLGNGSLCGVDLERFVARSATKSDYSKINMTEADALNCKNILYVGRICDDKGIKDLLGAYEKLRKNNIRLIVAGEIEESSEYYLKEFERLSVNYLGYVDNIEDIYPFVDIMVLPSKREGFGTVVIEANACSVVAIGSNIPGLVDSIDDGVTGVLVDNLDPERLAEAVNRLANDDVLLDKLKNNALSRARLLFDSKLMVSNWLDVYNLCLDP